MSEPAHVLLRWVRLAHAHAGTSLVRSGTIWRVTLPRQQARGGQGEAAWGSDPHRAALAPGLSRPSDSETRYYCSHVMDDKPRLRVATGLAQRHAARELALESRSVQTPFTTPNRLNTSGLSCFICRMGSEPLSHVWQRRWGRTETLARRWATQPTVP